MNTRWSHMWFALATDCALDIGFVLGSFVPLVLVLIFGDKNLEPVWRLTFGLGIVPAALVLLWRLRMPREPEHYRQSALKRNVPYFLILKRYWCAPRALLFRLCPRKLTDRPAATIFTGDRFSASPCAGSSTTLSSILSACSRRSLSTKSPARPLSCRRSSFGVSSSMRKLSTSS